MNAQYGTTFRYDVSGFFERISRDILLEPTEGTPFVKYNKEEKTLMIKGNSIRNQIHEFYNPIISTTKAHLNGGIELDIVFFFNMINPTTAKVLFDLFKFIRLKKTGGVKVNITWCVEASNHEMYETGADFAGIYDLDFKFLTV